MDNLEVMSILVKTHPDLPTALDEQAAIDLFTLLVLDKPPVLEVLARKWAASCMDGINGKLLEKSGSTALMAIDQVCNSIIDRLVQQISEPKAITKFVAEQYSIPKDSIILKPIELKIAKIFPAMVRLCLVQTYRQSLEIIAKRILKPS